jgi:iron complex outermembrane receptor protein
MNVRRTLRPQWLGWLAVWGVLWSQPLGSLTGIVVDDATGEPLVGVNILIENTFRGTATDQAGKFWLTDLSPGTYTLVVSMIGYRKEVLSGIAVTDAAPPPLEIRLVRDVLASPQVVVTATRKVQDIMEAPVSVAVVTPRRIREKAAVSLEEVLYYEAGVNIIKNQLNIRGASGYTLGAGSRSLLLLDGVPLLGSAAGNITWAVVPTSEISQVEIVKSGGSTLYGSSAMGGVLNIITRNAPARPETRLRSKVGRYSQPRYRQWRWRNHPGWFSITELTHARPFGEHSFWLRFQHRKDDGYTELNWREAVNLTGKVKLNFGRRYSASLYGNFLADRGGLESQWKSAADPFEAPLGSERDLIEGTKLNLNGFFNFIYSPTVVMRARGALYDVWWRNHGSNTDFSRETKAFGEYQVETNWSRSFNTTTGLALQQAWIHARIFGEHTSLSLAAYGLAQQRLGRALTLSFGGRYESYLVDGDLLNNRFASQVAVNYNPYRFLSLRGSVGSGFRNPTIAEMYSQSQLNVFKVEPNPELEPEVSLSAEVGATVRWSGTGGGSGTGSGWLTALQLDGALFRTDFENLIEPAPDRSGIIHFENLVRARISGAEVGLRAAFFGNRITGTVAYTYLDPLELDPRQQVIDTLSYRHRHHLVTTGTVSWRGWSATVEYRYASKIEQTELFQEDPRTGRDRRVPLHLWNVSLGYRRAGIEVLLRIENLFQYYYVELERNMGEERNLALTFSWTW